MKANGNNSRLLALSSVALSVAMLLGAFALVWLAPKDATPTSAQNKDSSGQADKSSQITVRGTGIISVKPDMMVVNLGVNIQDATIAGAQAQVSKVMDNVVAKLKAAGIAEADYRTTQFSIEPVMDYPGDKGGQPKLSGFRVVNMLEVTFHDPSKAPAILDQAVAAGANTVFNAGYTFSSPEELTKQAYDKAITDAHVRASRLAGFTGLTLGKIVNVTEASAGTPGVVYSKDGMGGGAAQAYPGQQQIQVDVIVTYEAN